MKWLSDETLAHLRKVTDWPDLTGSRYELVAKIGQGGMGAVYLVRDRELDRQVALKVINARCGDSEAGQRMLKEARILARLEHPSIVPVHDCGVLPDGRFFYVMKMVRGMRLDRQMDSKVERAERLVLFQKICDAVAFAHAQGVIHRDLKPQNIMVGAFGEVLILDWGLAEELSHESQETDFAGNGEPRDGESSRQTQVGSVIGTPGYMAPEQARGQIGLIDERADVYALGAILYYLLTGRAPAYDPPFDGSLISGGHSLQPPRQIDRSIPRSLDAVCLKALVIERGQRYSSVSELAADVTDFLAGRRVGAYAEGILESAIRLGTKYRTVLVLLLAYLIMRVALLLVSGP